MIRPLLGVRFRGLFAGMTAQGRTNKKKPNIGTVILYVILYIYVLAVVAGIMCFMFHSLVVPYHMLGLDWLYFAIAGTAALGISLIGSVFATQNQLYEAKDNAMLLSMPIKPGIILLSRMIPLLSLNLLFSAIVMLPAIVIYAIFVKLSWVTVVLPLIALFAVVFLAQALASLLGWGMHLLLAKLNKSAASLLFMVLFLGVYFGIYSNASELLNQLAVNGEAIAGILESWVWPLYAMGRGSLGSIPHLLGFLAITAGVFGIVYWVLSVTFLASATASHHSARRKKLTGAAVEVHSPRAAICHKELKKFLGTPVYLTNMGLGIILTGALPIAALIFRRDILDILMLFKEEFDWFADMIPVIICAVLCFTSSTCCISVPSVSLEGKNLWILKSMPIGGEDVLLGKLHLHMLLTVPIGAIAGLALGIMFECGLIGTGFCVLIPILLNTLGGLVGMWAGLKWAKFDYINEAYPCKQSVAVAVTMFGMMGLPVIFGILYYLLFDLITPTVFLGGAALILVGASYGLYKALLSWGVQKWDSL